MIASLQRLLMHQAPQVLATGYYINVVFSIYLK